MNEHCEATTLVRKAPFVYNYASWKLVLGEGQVTIARRRATFTQYPIYLYILLRVMQLSLFATSTSNSWQCVT